MEEALLFCVGINEKNEKIVDKISYIQINIYLK